MSALAKYLAAYETFHSKLITKITHFIGIPLIIFSLMILFGWVHVKVPDFFDMPLAWLLIIILLVYYFFLDIVLASAMMIVLVLMNLLASYFSQPVPTWFAFKIFAITLIVGLAFQLLGHLFESKKPAFLTNFKHLLIGPIFLVAEVFFYFGWKEDLKQKMIEVNVNDI